MKRILVPTDFSESAKNALEVAANLARKNNAKLYLLHMMGISQSIINKAETENFAEAMFYMELAKKRFAELQEEPFLKGVEVESIVQNYLMFSEVNELAHEKQIDLIVMGSHGTGKVSDFFVGSNTEKVVRTSDFPVLVIKKSRPDFSPKKAVFASDFEADNLHAWQKAMEVFGGMGVEVLPLYVNLPNEKFMSTPEIESRINQFMSMAYKSSERKPPVVTIVSDYTVENGIYQYCKKAGADLIGVPTHGRRGLSHFFLGSLGEDLANHADLPVLTFKIPS